MQPRVVHLPLIDFDRAFKLAYQCFLTADLLLGNGILLEQRAVALKINARVSQQRLIALHLPLRLQELRLIGTRIDLGEQIALLDGLALLEQYAHQLTLNATAYRYRAQRRHRAQTVEVNIDVARARNAGRHRCGRATASATFTSTLAGTFARCRVALGVPGGGSFAIRFLVGNGRFSAGNPLLITPISATAQGHRTQQPSQPFG